MLMRDVIPLPRARLVLACYRPDGSLRWRDGGPNQLKDAARVYFMGRIFNSGSLVAATYYVGLIDNTGLATPIATETMASHPNWGEFTAYAEAARPSYTFGAVDAAANVSNEGSVAQFNVNATGSIWGAFLATDSTKGGAAGTLINTIANAAVRSVESGDLLTATLRFGGRQGTY